MADIAELAGDHQDRVIRINTVATDRALNAWGNVDFDALDSSWSAVGPVIAAEAANAQLAAVSSSDSYVNRVAAEFDFDMEPSRTVPEALAGVSGRGRPVADVLLGAVISTKEAVGAGLGRVRSLETGAAYLATVMKTLIADSGRSGDMVAATGKGFTRYVRVISPGACSRCAILAGISTYKQTFLRHPACKCTSCPVPDDRKLPAGVFDSTEAYFDSLTEQEQDRIFTNAGAQAIRDGASPQSVVTARRKATGITTAGRGETTPNSGRRLEKTLIGRRPDGTPVEVYTTTEGTTRRGSYGRSRGARLRVMPEEIYNVARTPAEARVLLRDAGYLETPGLTRTQRAAQAESDRKLADRIYGRAGYSLG